MNFGMAKLMADIMGFDRMAGQVAVNGKLEVLRAERTDTGWIVSGWCTGDMYALMESAEWEPMCHLPHGRDIPKVPGTYKRVTQ